ncbi:MAG: serine protease [bacterium]|nr:serine protease [bacterium]MDD3805353.1 serine protease [bacterium]MDD4558003.1 serine protease [bacterium]
MSIRNVSIFMVPVCFFSILFAALPVQSDDAALCRETIAKNQSAVVTLEVVAVNRVSMFGEERKSESKSEAAGMIIDPSGLIVSSLAMINPSEFFSEIFSSISAEGDIKQSGEITGLKILLPGGQEIPARVVLRDKDLDLVFINPLKKPDKPLPFMDLNQVSTPALLDQVLLLGRLGVVGNRTICADLCRVRAIIEKPRTFFVLNDANNYGGPAFTMDGKLLGITTIRKLPREAVSSSGMGNNILPVVLPVADVAEVAKEALAAVKKKR